MTEETLFSRVLWSLNSKHFLDVLRVGGWREESDAEKGIPAEVASAIVTVTPVALGDNGGGGASQGGPPPASKKELSHWPGQDRSSLTFQAAHSSERPRSRSSGTNYRITSHGLGTWERTQFSQQGDSGCSFPGAFVHPSANQGKVYASENARGLGFLSGCLFDSCRKENAHNMQNLMCSISGAAWTLLSFPIMPPVASSHDLVPLPCNATFSLPQWLPQACSCRRTFALAIPSV